jgi:hypothetical protein
MEGSAFSRSAAIADRYVSHGSVIVLMRVLVAVLRQEPSRPP